MWSKPMVTPRGPLMLCAGLLFAVLGAFSLDLPWLPKPAEEPAGEPNLAAAPEATTAPEATAAPIAATKPLAPNYLSTSGSKLIDSSGAEVRLTGVNWFGMETGTFSPHGLWARNWESMLDQIAALGFNTIRLPYSNQVLDPNAKPVEGIDYQLNPDLQGLNGLEIMDKIVTGAGDRGLKIILDQHRPNTDAQSKLWYTDFLSEEQWIADWQTLAKRYLGNDTVIGADLHNEPAGDATWGGTNPKRDWRAAAERAGNAILAVNPNLLIVVEGVENVGRDGYWMGGNLSAAGDQPVKLNVPNKVVYSAHDYGPGVYDQEWFKDRAFPANLPGIWDRHWGYLVKQNVAPVIIGEFGGKSVDPKDREGVWQRALLDYMRENGISFTYWSFNPNSSDTGGVLQDDWQTPNRHKSDLLAGNFSSRIAVNTPNLVDHSSVALTPRRNPLPDKPIRVQFAAGRVDPVTSDLNMKLTLINQTASRVPLDRLELRYWLSIADSPDATWATQGASTAIWPSKGSSTTSAVRIDRSSAPVTAELVPRRRGGQTHYLKLAFDKSAGTLAGWGHVEVQLRMKRPDKGTFNQADDFSFRPTTTSADNDAISLYFWGKSIWGREPAAVEASALEAPPTK